MWPFGSRKIAADDLKRVDLLEEKVDSLVRRYASLVEDLEEFYAKVNKARQRVVKEDRDAARTGHSDVEDSRDVIKARLRASLRQRA